MTVTPVLIGPFPTTSFPLPEISVVWPTSTPVTSVIASSGPAVPPIGKARSRARGFVLGTDCPCTTDTVRASTTTRPGPKRHCRFIDGSLSKCGFRPDAALGDTRLTQRRRCSRYGLDSRPDGANELVDLRLLDD